MRSLVTRLVVLATLVVVAIGPAYLVWGDRVVWGD